MSAKKKIPKIPRTYLIIALIIIVVFLIILGISLNQTNVEDEEVITVSQAISPNNQYIGENVKVKGVYHTESEGEYYLKANYESDANPTPFEMLSLNLSEISNETELIENNLYIISGLLTQNQYGYIELEATKVDKI